MWGEKYRLVLPVLMANVEEEISITIRIKKKKKTVLKASTPTKQQACASQVSCLWKTGKGCRILSN